MCHKPNEIEVHVNEKVRNARKYEAGIRKDGKRRVPAQVRDLPEVQELDVHANWLISCMIEELDEQLAERLWIEAMVPDAAGLLDWYFNPDVEQRDRINDILEECAFLEDEENYFAKMEGHGDLRRPF